MPDVLLIGDTLRCMALRHEVPVDILDPFAYAEVDGTRYVGVHALEHENVTQAAPDVTSSSARWRSTGRRSSSHRARRV